MPRVARNIHEGGHRHVIVRGIGKQILFEDENDYRFYIKMLEKYSMDTDVGICAYCLMENHVHLLLNDKSTDTALFMKKMGVSYSAFYNGRYERTGHLFQDRYKSENICDDRGYLAVLRYILRNPEKAGISRIEEYRWSSFSSYGDRKSFLDQALTWELLRNKDEFREFMMTDGTEVYMEYQGRNDDEWAKDVIRSVLGIRTGTMVQRFERQERDQTIRTLRSRGLSIRQIERLTGINRGIIQKV